MKLIIRTFFIILLLDFYGCSTFSTLQRAETVERGKTVLGANVILFGVNLEKQTALLYPEITMRHGVFKRVDVGVKYSLPQTVVVDMKLELVKNPFTVSLDLAYSHFSEHEHYKRVVSDIQIFEPSLIIGGKKWYLAVKKPILIHSYHSCFFFCDGESDNMVIKVPTSSFSMGGVFGKKLHILPELSIVFGSDKMILIVPSMGFQLDLK